MIINQKIKKLQTAIAATLSEIEFQTNENTQFTEALNLLTVGAAVFVPSGRLPMMDAISNLLQESTDELERAERWKVAHIALERGNQALLVLRKKLVELRSSLAELELEKEWQERYEPHVNSFRKAFSLPSPEALREEKIKNLQKDIDNKKDKYRRAQAWINEPEGNKSYYPGDAIREEEYLARLIPTLQKQLQGLRDEPINKDLNYETKLREFVKARVEIKTDIDKFLKVQEQYVIELAQLKKALVMHPTAVEFKANELKEPRVVYSNENGAIKLSEEEKEKRWR